MYNRIYVLLYIHICKHIMHFNAVFSGKTKMVKDKSWEITDYILLGGRDGRLMSFYCIKRKFKLSNKK